LVVDLLFLCGRPIVKYVSDVLFLGGVLFVCLFGVREDGDRWKTSIEQNTQATKPCSESYRVYVSLHGASHRLAKVTVEIRYGR